MSKDDFGAALDQFIEKARKESTRRIRRAGMVALRKIVLRTPVDTGCCRANWRASVGFLDRTFNPAARDKSGAATTSAASARLESAVLGVDLWIGNSTPYVKPLEFGYSKQSPEGMVQVTADEVKNLIERGAL